MRANYALKLQNKRRLEYAPREQNTLVRAMCLIYLYSDFRLTYNKLCDSNEVLTASLIRHVSKLGHLYQLLDYIGGLVVRIVILG